MSDTRNDASQKIDKLEVYLHTQVAAYCKALQQRHAEAPDDYDLDDDTGIIDMFSQFLLQGDI